MCLCQSQKVFKVFSEAKNHIWVHNLVNVVCKQLTKLRVQLKQMSEMNDANLGISKENFFFNCSKELAIGDYRNLTCLRGGVKSDL